MPTLSIPKQYSANNVLQKSHLDAIEDAIETFLNTTQIGYDNISVESTLQSLSQAQAETILTAAGYGNISTTTLALDTTLTSTATDYNTTASIAAGKYLLVANALVLARTTADTSVSAVTNNVYVDVYNLQTNNPVVPSGIVKKVVTGMSAVPSKYDQFETTAVLTFIYPVTLTTSSTFAFRAYRDTSGSDHRGFLLENSSIQLYRFRS